MVQVETPPSTFHLFHPFLSLFLLPYGISGSSMEQSRPEAGGMPDGFDHKPDGLNSTQMGLPNELWNMLVQVAYSGMRREDIDRRDRAVC